MCVPFIPVSLCWASWCVRFHNRVYLDLIHYNYPVHCCTTYESRMYLYKPAIISAAALCCYSAAACRCCSSSCAGNAKLVAVVHCILISSFVFLSNQTRFFFVPLGSTVASIYLINTYKTSSVIAGMRGAKVGVSPPRRSPPCIYVHIEGFRS